VDVGPLLPGENVLYQGKANALISPKEHALGPFATGGALMTLAGLEGKEAIGGKLYVTTVRLIFSSHRFNRLRGRLATPISLITRAERFRNGLTMGLEVETEQSTQKFVSWSPDKSVAAIAEVQKLQVGRPDIAEQFDAALADQLGGWKVDAGLDGLNSVARVFFAVTGEPSAFDLLTLASAQAVRSRDQRATP
jgi:hypothetical protein